MEAGMSKFEINPSRRMRVCAALLAIGALLELIVTHRVSTRVNAAVMLLMAWQMAFVPSLPLNLTLGEIYQKARQGWRMSRTSRIINYVTFALIILAIYLQWHGR
jgi:hypothetical protein